MQSDARAAYGAASRSSLTHARGASWRPSFNAAEVSCAVSMSAYLQTGMGILVSLALFLIGYRQSIGARKQRAKAANASLVRALLRRVVLEEYEPRLPDLHRLLEGKALEYQVRVSDLMTDEQLLHFVFTNVFDSELIAPEKRAEVESRLRAAHEELAKSQDVPPVDDADSASHMKTMALAVSAAIVGTVAVVVPDLIRGETPDLTLLGSALAAFVGSVAIIQAITAVRRTRDVTDEPARSSPPPRIAQLETEVARMLDAEGYKYSIEAPAGKYLRVDFLVTVNERRVALEVRPWRDLPLSYLARTVNRIAKLKELSGATDAVIVVDDAKNVPHVFAAGDVRILSPSELRAFLKKLRSATAA